MNLVTQPKALETESKEPTQSSSSTNTKFPKAEQSPFHKLFAPSTIFVRAVSKRRNHKIVPPLGTWFSVLNSTVTPNDRDDGVNDDNGGGVS